MSLVLVTRPFHHKKFCVEQGLFQIWWVAGIFVDCSYFFNQTLFHQQGQRFSSDDIFKCGVKIWISWYILIWEGVCKSLTSFPCCFLCFVRRKQEVLGRRCPSELYLYSMCHQGLLSFEYFEYLSLLFMWYLCIFLEQDEQWMQQ